jgi:ribosome biogenesis ATPase
MIALVKEADAGIRRMKYQQIEELVVRAIEVVKSDAWYILLLCIELIMTIVRQGSDNDEEEDEPLMDEEAVVVAPPNSMNQSLVARYAAFTTAPVTPAETPVVKVEQQVTKTEQVAKSDVKPASKSKKRKTSSTDYAPPSTRYADLGGIDECIEEVRELIEAPLVHPEIYSHLNIAPPRGVLFHGPPGCGKTQLARAVAGEIGVPFIQISAPSVVSGMSGESEKKLREVFEDARQYAPCILFIDEIDAITPKRETAQREMERRIVAQLLTCLDDLCLEKTDGKPVIVIGATNRPDSLDPALRRAGRFDREICLGIPNEQARFRILQVITAKLRLAGDFEFDKMAKLTPGYVGADLMALTTAAGVIALNRIFGTLAAANETTMMDDDQHQKDMSPISKFLKTHPDPLTAEQLEPLAMNMDDFIHALKKVQPSSKREGFASVPDVSWDHIGALGSVREELRLSIVEPIRYPQLFAEVGIQSASGVLLWGPPGCGKTLLAKAVANESHCNFISVKGPELLNKFVGESERGVRQVFARARASAPCVIFFDELDALCPKRGNGSDSQTSERVVNQLLTELDGMEDRKNVYIIAATNRPDIIDRAILRPGRFDKLVYVQLPTASERADILRTLGRNLRVSDEIEWSAIAERCDRFSGADLSSLIRESGLCALKEALGSQSPEHVSRESLLVQSRHFEQALGRIKASVTPADLKSYERVERTLNGSISSNN